MIYCAGYWRIITPILWQWQNWMCTGCWSCKGTDCTHIYGRMVEKMEHTVAYNSTETPERAYQWGGTTVWARNRISHHAMDQGSNATGLCQWCLFALECWGSTVYVLMVHPPMVNPRDLQCLPFPLLVSPHSSFACLVLERIDELYNVSFCLAIVPIVAVAVSFPHGWRDLGVVEATASVACTTYVALASTTNCGTGSKNCLWAWFFTGLEEIVSFAVSFVPDLHMQSLAYYHIANKDSDELQCGRRRMTPKCRWNLVEMSCPRTTCKSYWVCKGKIPLQTPVKIQAIFATCSLICVFHYLSSAEKSPPTTHNKGNWFDFFLSCSFIVENTLCVGVIPASVGPPPIIACCTWT